MNAQQCLSTRPSIPAASGDWSTDCLKGRTYANSMIEILEGNETLLVYAAREMIRAGVYTGVEVGFFTRIAERAA